MSFKATELIRLGRSYFAATAAIRAYQVRCRRDGLTTAHYSSIQWLDMSCKCASFVCELAGIIGSRSNRATRRYLEAMRADYAAAAADERCRCDEITD